MRDAFAATVEELLDSDPRTAVVLAEISTEQFAGALSRHPDRAINVGIREQLMIGVTGGLALTGLRAIAHSYAPFLVERAYEQIKIDLDHQGVGAILVSVGASYDRSPSGRTHHSPADVALIDTLTGWTVQVPGHPAEVGPLLRAAARHDDPVYLRLSTQSTRFPPRRLPGGSFQQNSAPQPGTGLTVIRPGGRGTVVAIGPLLDPVLAATEGLDVTVAYTNTPRPFDEQGLRALVGDAGPAEVVLVEPYLAGTSARIVAGALQGVPHRLLALGVTRTDQRIYGTPDDHARAHGLDPASLRAAIAEFLW
jgi:transketolase